MPQNGEVRVPGSAMLAGSALRLDQAVRNLVVWGLAAPADAVRSWRRTTPRRLLAPALAAHAIRLPKGQISWSAELVPVQVRLDGRG